MYFRVEDENGLDPNLRVYYNVDSYNMPIDASEADVLIANEIREQVNNCNNRSIFSFSKSLGIVLFKYNQVADNPIHLLPICGNWLEFDLVNNNGELRSYRIPYDINNLNYPMKQHFGNKKIILKNYCIDVDNDIVLDIYLKNYTNIGKKKMAACQKDSEVIIRHVGGDFIISDNINAVYLIYALQYKTRFLNCDGVVQELINMFNKEIENENELNAFQYLVPYLQEAWNYEQEISKRILEEKRQEGRYIPCYDAYCAALDIMDGDIDDALSDCKYYLHRRIISNIWSIFTNRYKLIH